jgi:NitT/TauT family transport system permease protein
MEFKGALDVETVEKEVEYAALSKVKKRVSVRLRWGIGSVFILLFVWELASRVGWIDAAYFSAPSKVIVTAIIELINPEFYLHLSISLTELIIGYSMAVVVGIVFGLLMGHFRTLSSLFDPLLMALYATPRVALVPLFVVWFGLGIWSKVFVVFMGAVFPILINTMTGIRQVDPLLLRAGRSFGATKSQLFVKVLLPGSLPAMIAGLRLGWARGIIGLIIGEMYVSTAGLGQRLVLAGSAMRTDLMFFLIVFVALIGLLGSNGFRWLEQRMSQWRKDESVE